MQERLCLSARRPALPWQAAAASCSGDAGCARSFTASLCCLLHPAVPRTHHTRPMSSNTWVCSTQEAPIA